jgi:hypothetical protein
MICDIIDGKYSKRGPYMELLPKWNNAHGYMGNYTTLLKQQVHVGPPTK